MKKPVLRQCIICRSMKEKADLFKITRINENDLVIDYENKLNGRSAYICKDNACIDLLLKKRALDRSFKIKISESKYEEIIEEIRQK